MDNNRLNEELDLESITMEGVGVYRIDAQPIMFGTDCMICRTFIEGIRAPVICDDCRRRLMRMLYPNRREDL